MGWTREIELRFSLVTSVGTLPDVDWDMRVTHFSFPAAALPPVQVKQEVAVALLRRHTDLHRTESAPCCCHLQGFWAHGHGRTHTDYASPL